MKTQFLNKNKLILLTFTNLITNVLLFVLVILMFFGKLNTSVFVGIITSIGILYYISFAFFFVHYTLFLSPILKNNKDLIYGIIFLSAFVIGYFIFYYFVDKNIAHSIFGSVIALSLLNFGISSFRKWKSERNKKRKNTKKVKALTDY